jgi:hypothetical protein
MISPVAAGEKEPVTVVTLPVRPTAFTHAPVAVESCWSEQVNGMLETGVVPLYARPIMLIIVRSGFAVFSEWVA